MIIINRSNPWILWPESLCQNFIINSALDLFDNNEYWKIDISFLYSDDSTSRYDIFAIIPNFTGISIIDNEIYIGNEYDSFSDFTNTNIQVNKDIKYKLELENVPNKLMNIYINNELVYKINLEDTPLKPKTKSKLILGSSDWNYNKVSTDVDYNLTFFDFKIKSSSEIMTHHNFNNIIHDKSLDLSDNFNLFYKMN